MYIHKCDVAAVSSHLSLPSALLVVNRPDLCSDTTGSNIQKSSWWTCRSGLWGRSVRSGQRIDTSSSLTCLVFQRCPLRNLKQTTTDAHGSGDLLVTQTLEVTMLVHVVHHCATLWFHPALRHEVCLRVHVHSLHLSVVVIIGGEA